MSQLNVNQTDTDMFLEQQFNMTENYNCTPVHDEDVSCMPYPGTIKLVPLWEIVVKSILYAVIILFSLIGNILIIVIVLRNRRMRTTTNYYIVNLAVADLMVTLSCSWVSLVEDVTEGWVLGAFFCKMNTFTQVLSLVASVLSLTLIAYDRFFGIVFALRAHMTERSAKTSLIFIWICSIAIAVPTLIYRELKVRQWFNHTERWCDDEWPIHEEKIPVTNGTNGTVRVIQSMPSRSIYYTTVSVILYFVPMLIMILAYSVIIFKLWSTTTPGETVDKRVEQQARTKRKVIIMLVVIVTVFGICWLPLIVILLYSELRTDRGQLQEWFYDLKFVGGCMAYTNSALNPLIYAGFNENFKQGIKDVWTCVSCKSKPRYANGKSYGTYSGNITMTNATLLGIDLATFTTANYMTDTYHNDFNKAKEKDIDV